MNIIIADDHDLVRDALALLIKKDEPDAVVWQACDLGQAMDMTARQGPVDLVLLDVYMPGMDDMMGLKRMVDTHPTVPVVLMSGMIRSGDVTRAFELGAKGFIPKTLSGKALVSVLKMVLSGVRYVPDILLEQKARKPGQDFNLSPREGDVLQQLFKGYSNKVIARKLGIEETTVKLHLRSLFRKLGVQNRTEAVIVATDNDLVRREDRSP